MRVLAFPADHPYIAAVSPQAWDPMAGAAVWWPHPALAASWWDSAPPIDIVHLHFGFEHLSLEQTEDFIHQLRRRAIPLVLTVHDIDNPHLADQRHYHQQLKLLMAYAAVLLTLTTSAQEQIARDFGYQAQVVPHPHVVPLERIARPDPLAPAAEPAAELAAEPAAEPATGGRVGIFLKSMRGNVIADPHFYAQLGPVTIFLHPQQDIEPQLAALDQVELVIHEPMEDDELFAAVSSCSAVVLPYTRGTHSGWLEMCRDLAVPVVVPDCGHYLGQADTPAAVRSYRTADPLSCRRALAHLTGPIPYAGDRAAQLEHIQQFHRELYQQLGSTAAPRSLKIALVAPSRFPVREPYAGGLEAFCAIAVRAFRRHGHQVDLYAVAGSDGHEQQWEFPGVDWTGYEDQRTDNTYPPGEREKEDAAFARLRQHLSHADYDVIFNNSLHPGLFAPADAADAAVGTAADAPAADGDGDAPAVLPLVTTLHTPGFWEVQQGITKSSHPGRFAAVSRATAASWTLPTPARIIPNTFDEQVWQPGPGGPRALWVGRIVPEKGVHCAIDAARSAGLELTVVGRVGNPEYYRAEVLPRLGPDIELVGELSHQEIAQLMGRSQVCVVTPLWEEPFGLVVIEAMACGTPVAALARGGVAEILEPFPQLLAANVEQLPAAIAAAQALDRAQVARWAAENFGSAAFVRRYRELFEEVL